jgi:hypothetical protein
MKRVNLDQRLPKLKKIADGIAKLRGRLPVCGPLSRTVSKICGSIVPPARVDADGRFRPSETQLLGHPLGWQASREGK